MVFDDEEEHTVARFEDEQTLEKALEAFKQLQIMPDAGRKLFKDFCHQFLNNLFSGWTSLYKPNVGWVHRENNRQTYQEALIQWNNEASQLNDFFIFNLK